MSTAVTINDAILRDPKSLAAETGKTFREVLEETLRRGPASPRVGSGKQKFQVRAHPLGLKSGFHGMGLDLLYDQAPVAEGRHLDQTEPEIAERLRGVAPRALKCSGGTEVLPESGAEAQQS